MEDPDLGTPSYDLEQQIDAEFSNLHRSISRITAEVYKCGPDVDTRTLQAAVKESLANIRANIRVLEELAEEQDRCSLISKSKSVVVLVLFRCL